MSNIFSEEALKEELKQNDINIYELNDYILETDNINYNYVNNKLNNISLLYTGIQKCIKNNTYPGYEEEFNKLENKYNLLRKDIKIMKYLDLRIDVIKTTLCNKINELETRILDLEMNN